MALVSLPCVQQCVLSVAFVILTGWPGSTFGQAVSPKPPGGVATDKPVQKRTPRPREYSIDLRIKKLDAGKIMITVQTNFPEKTNLLVGVSRSYYLKGKSEEFSGDIFKHDVRIKAGRIKLEVPIDDSVWYREYKKRKAQFKAIVFDIDRISPEVEVQVLFSPKRNQPAEVSKILGVNGEFVRGRGTQKYGDVTAFRVAKTIAIPFKG